jgi:serine/threonine protein kinase
VHDCDRSRSHARIGASPAELPTLDLTALEPRGYIARGAFGVVNGYFDPVSGRELAVKSVSLTASAAAELMREVAILASLDHPCVLPLLAVRPPTAADPALLITTEWIRPGALAFDPERSTTDAAKIVVGIAPGMTYLHSQNVLHRDLKPANVLVDQAMRPHICDFGFSKVCGFDATQSLDRGTPLYMAPEMHTGNHYGPPVDVFAWACTAYELITGKRVLEGKVRFQIANAAKSGARPPIPSEWSPEFARLMERAWTVDPKERLPFAEILSVIEECDYRLWQAVDASAVREFVSDIQRQAAASRRI